MSKVHVFVDEGLGHSSYLVELGDGTAAIVDPPRFPTDHLGAAERQDTPVRWTIDTHSHADYVSGSPSLTMQTGATFVAPAASKLATAHQPVHDEHVPGSLSDTLRPAFASWLGWIIELDRPVVIIADADQDRAEIVRQAFTIGHDNIVGELDGGIDAWRGAHRPTVGIPLVDAAGLVGTVIDVRQRAEYEAGHVPGAINIELGDLSRTAVPDGPLTMMCGHGERAMTGASILTSRGHDEVRVFRGGPETWADWSGRSATVG